MAASTTLDSLSGSKQTSSLVAEAGGLQIKSNIYIDTTSGSSINDDRSYVLLQDKYKSLVQLIGGSLTIKSNADLYIGAGQNLFTSVRGDSQTVAQGDKHSYVHGNETKQVGEATSKQVDAAKSLQDATHDIDKKKIDTIKKEKGSEVPCPTCSSKILTDRSQCLIDQAFKIIRFTIPNLPYPLEVIQKYLNMLITPFLSDEKVESLNQGKGCGSPGCKNGKVNSKKEAIQKANESAAKDLESKQKKLEKHQKDLGSGGTHAMGPFMSDVAIHVGHPKAMNKAPTTAEGENTTTPFGFLNSEEGKGLFPHTKGNCKQVIHSDPLINPGSLFLGVAQKFTLAVGSPGIDVHTTGKAQFNGAVTTIAATEGELTLMSKNLTTIKGKNILIDGNDRSGDNGIRMEANNVMVAGALHVSGDTAIKGSLLLDGGLHCTHITAPGERVSTGPSNSSNSVHLGANWNNPLGSLKATLTNLKDSAVKIAGRDLFNTLSKNIFNGTTPMFTLAMEAYDRALLQVPVDNTGLPTGYASTYFAVPGAPAGTPLMVEGFGVTSSGDAVTLTYAFVTPGQTLPIFNFPHNHGNAGDEHAHDYTSYHGHQVANATTARASRPQPSHVPTPAKPTGMGSKPGHKSIGDLCIPCINPFGGNGNKAAISKRNSQYGLGPTDGDAYNGNFVAADGEFTEDGTLTPPPTFNLGCD
jgi:hypothetical protein